MRQHMKDYIEFGHSGAARGVRLLAEYSKATEAFGELTGQPLVTIFGSARLGDGTPAGAAAEDLARRCVQAGYGVVTGGSAGVMFTANRGAYEEAQKLGVSVERHSVGCAITLPFEEGGNRFLGTQTDFHYFFIRKFFLVAYSKAFFFMEGGAGTRDELWEVFCLIQTGKMPIHPLVAVGPAAAWRGLKLDLEVMAERKTISPPDAGILHFAETPEAALAYVQNFYRRVEQIEYSKDRHSIDIRLRTDLSRGDLEKIERDFSEEMGGLRWNPQTRVLSISQFHFRSYTSLYNLVRALSAG